MENKDFEICGIPEAKHTPNEKHDSYFVAVIKRFCAKTKVRVVLSILAAIILLSIFGPVFSPYKFDEVIQTEYNGKTVIASGISPTLSYKADSAEMEAFQGKAFLFGTDDIGRDLWTRTWRGARVSLLIALVTLLADMVIGMIYGLVSGYVGGAVDSVMQRFIEIVNAIPGLVVVAILAIFMPKGVGLIITAIIITEWIGMSKITRAQTLAIKNMEYIEASRTLGSGHLKIIFSCILPNTIGPVITQVLFSVPGAIFTEAFLSFVGVGIQLPDCSIGSLIQVGFDNLSSLPYQLVPPILILSVLILCFSFIGDGLKEAFKPKASDM